MCTFQLKAQILLYTGLHAFLCHLCHEQSNLPGHQHETDFSAVVSCCNWNLGLNTCRRVCCNFATTLTLAERGLRTISAFGEDLRTLVTMKLEILTHKRTPFHMLADKVGDIDFAGVPSAHYSLSKWPRQWLRASCNLSCYMIKTKRFDQELRWSCSESSAGDTRLPRVFGCSSEPP